MSILAMIVAGVVGLLGTVGLGSLLPVLPAVAAGGLVVSVIGWFASTFVTNGKWKVTLKIVFGLICLLCVIGFVVYFERLKQKAISLKALQAEVQDLATGMGCGKGEDVLVCFHRQRTEAADAAAAKLREERLAHFKAEGVLNARRQAAEDQLAESDALADADQDAGDALPPALGRYYDRKRAARGLK